MRKFYGRLTDYYEKEKAYLKLSFDECHLFDGTLSFTPFGSSTEVSYPALLPISEIITNSEAIVDYWVTFYGDQRVAFPVKDLSEEELRRVAIYRLQPAIINFLAANTLKYRKLIETLCYKYNPIENYRSLEEKTTVYGDRTFSHKVDKLGTDTQVVAPHTDVSISAPQESHFNNPDQADAQPGYLYSTDFTGDEGNQVTTIIDEETTTNDSGAPTVEHYTTTYDDSSAGRLAAYDVRSGSSTQSRTTGENGNKQIEHLTPSAASSTHRSEEYTDTTDAEDDSYTLEKSGNIGVTTTQQMLQAERELADFDVVKMFFEELNKYVLLQIWD